MNEKLIGMSRQTLNFGKVKMFWMIVVVILKSKLVEFGELKRQQADVEKCAEKMRTQKCVQLVECLSFTRSLLSVSYSSALL